MLYNIKLTCFSKIIVKVLINESNRAEAPKTNLSFSRMAQMGHDASKMDLIESGTVSYVCRDNKREDTSAHGQVNRIVETSAIRETIKTSIRLNFNKHHSRK